MEESDQEITPATEEERELLSMTPSRERQSPKALVVEVASVVEVATEAVQSMTSEETEVREARHTATTVALEVEEQERTVTGVSEAIQVGELEAQARTPEAPTDSFITTTMDRNDSSYLLTLRRPVR